MAKRTSAPVKKQELVIVGFDTEYFKHILSLSNPAQFSRSICRQYYGDVRKFNNHFLEGINHIVYLAAISNDPMGNEFESVTKDVNYKSALKIAKVAKDLGVSNYVFASSCSVYGFAEDGMRTESSDLNPLTAYAKSKINAEKDLEDIANQVFNVTCLRFATACGFSSRLRLDLVLNDFVASTVTRGKIEILSDGTPWRPLIHVKDMARAMSWAINRIGSNGGNFLAVNAGSNDWNYQIKELAEGVKQVLPQVFIEINEKAAPDKRSYKVDFSLFADLAPDFCPIVSLEEAVRGLVLGLKEINFNDSNFRESQLLRLNILRDHINSNRLNKNLEWI